METADGPGIWLGAGQVSLRYSAKMLLKRKFTCKNSIAAFDGKVQSYGQML